MRLATWDHNRHYHRLLLAEVPASARTALDVGCGLGELARNLAARGLVVDALDVSEQMIEAARGLDPALGPRSPSVGLADHGRDGENGPSSSRPVQYLAADILAASGTAPPLRSDAYDVVTCVACLHHLPLEAGMLRLRDCVAPGGVLLLVGLYRPVTVQDRVVAVAAVPVNFAVRCARTLVRGTHGRRGQAGVASMPTAPATVDLPRIRQVAGELLPGARIRRRLLWRYTLVWRCPAG